MFLILMSLEENIVELETSEFYDEAQTTANSMIEKINPDHQQNWYENNSYKDENTGIIVCIESLNCTN
jgi:hypothetical protein